MKYLASLQLAASVIRLLMVLFKMNQMAIYHIAKLSWERQVRNATSSVGAIVSGVADRQGVELSLDMLNVFRRHGEGSRIEVATRRRNEVLLQMRCLLRREVKVKGLNMKRSTGLRAKPNPYSIGESQVQMQKFVNEFDVLCNALGYHYAAKSQNEVLNFNHLPQV